ncbi:Wadjet anti-phage system protein JetD domain-containing protein [Pseudochelatococcus lubricantis]|uniref:Wadjet anti-phage system protein JetD domain-containing protein n=1 Tax=Pseudochelatococcus lubricantis TaxID=1538102 RepID=UPI0035E840EE
MKQYTDIDRLVDEMLNRLESKGGSTRLFSYPGTFSSTAEEDAFMARLDILEREGALIVKRVRRDGVHLVQHVRLADPAPLYAYRRRTPAKVLSRGALGPLRIARIFPGNIKEIIDEIDAAWSRGVAWGGLQPGRAAELSNAVKAVEALRGAQLDPTLAADYRTFSRRAVGDTKFLEKRMGLILSIYRRVYPDSVADPELDDKKFLATLGIQRLPQPILLGGRLAVDGQVIPAMPYVGVAPDHAHRISVDGPTYLLTVENYASFVRHCREVNQSGNGLVIYTGGFPGRQILQATTALASSTRCPVFHWGDLDRGGLRIFTHLERALRGVGRDLWPHLMNSDVLAAYGTASTHSVGQPPAVASGSAIEDLWRLMAEADPELNLEQEALDPVSPVNLG